MDFTREIFDISPPLTPKTAVWPGDLPFSRAVHLDLAEGANLTLSSLTTSVHVGAHADAPSHYAAQGKSIDQVNLRAYLGPCFVISVNLPPQGLIGPEHCQAALAARVPRILFRTRSQTNPEHFNTDFVSFNAEAIATLGKAGVVLVGIDTASVDPFSSKDLPAHQALHRYGIANLEGLVLGHVLDGLYDLVALPLRLVGFDASPVRAVLLR